MRALMKFALKADIIKNNPMGLVENLKVSKPEIHPISMDKVHLFLDAVNPFYRDFFVVAFFTGMRFGEMAALKWKNVDFKLGVIKIRETRVRGEEGSPKTPGSVRDITILQPVLESLKNFQKWTQDNSEYVFLNQNGVPLLPNSGQNKAPEPTFISNFPVSLDE